MSGDATQVQQSATGDGRMRVCSRVLGTATAAEYTTPAHRPPTRAWVSDAGAVTVLAGQDLGDPDAGVVVTVNDCT